MKFEMIKNVVTSKVGRQILLTKRHSPGILFFAGVTGVGVSTVLACKATLRLEEVLEEAENTRKTINELQHKDYTEEDRRADTVKVKVKTASTILRLYSPAIAVGVVSIAALTGSHVVLTRRNAAIMAAYSALDKGFNEYRARVRAELGDEKDLHFRHGVETVSETAVNSDGELEVVDTRMAPGKVPSIYARFFDELSPSWSRQPEYNQVFLNCQQNYANDLLKSRGHVFLNEVYDMLGIPRSQAGAVVGWVVSKEGDNFIDFGIYDANERARAFVNGQERSILLDFNVDGVIYDLI